jgi:hypothetical protein
MEPAAKSRPYRPALREGGRFDPLAAGRPILTFEDVHKCYRVDAPVLKGLAGIIEGTVDPERWTQSLTAPKPAGRKAAKAA